MDVDVSGVVIEVAVTGVDVVAVVLDNAWPFSFELGFEHEWLNLPVDGGTVPPARTRSQGFGGETVAIGENACAPLWQWILSHISEENAGWSTLSASFVDFYPFSVPQSARLLDGKDISRNVW